jgi:hypothetical protein
MSKLNISLIVAIVVLLAIVISRAEIRIGMGNESDVQTAEIKTESDMAEASENLIYLACTESFRVLDTISERTNYFIVDLDASTIRSPSSYIRSEFRLTPLIWTIYNLNEAYIEANIEGRENSIFGLNRVSGDLIYNIDVDLAPSAQTCSITQRVFDF